MDKVLFMKIEENLYGYFKDKNKIISVRKEIATVSNLINTLERNIQTCNGSIDPNILVIGIIERVPSSSNGTTYVGREIEKAIDDMEKERSQRIRKLYKLQCEERNLIYKIEKIESNISMLNEECKSFIELRYNKGLGVREVALELNMSKNTAYGKRNELVNSIAESRCC